MVPLDRNHRQTHARGRAGLAGGTPDRIARWFRLIETIGKLMRADERGWQAAPLTGSRDGSA